MGFFKELEDSFLEGMHAAPSVPLFGVRVKKGVSPVDPKRLAGRYALIREHLTELHQRLCLTDSDTDSFVRSFAHYTAMQCFDEAEIPTPEDRFLYRPLCTMIERIAATDPKFVPLKRDFPTIPVDEHFVLSETLNDLETFLQKGEEVVDVCSTHFVYFGASMLSNLPGSIASAKKNADLSLSSPLIDALAEPHEDLATSLRHFVGMDAESLRAHDLLNSFREKLFQRVLEASGLKVEDLEKKELDTPLNHLKTPASELTTKFLGRTPLAKLYLTPVPYGF